MFDSDNKIFGEDRGKKEKKDMCVFSVPRAKDNLRGLSRQSALFLFHYIFLK